MQHRKLDRLMTPVERIARVAAAGLTSATSSVTKPSGAKSYDNADGTRTIIGNVANGESNPSYTMATHVGDVTAPGTPTGVTASSKSGVVVVEWDGTLTGGIPDDFCCVRVYLDNVELGILTGAGSVSSASLEGGTTHSVTATAEDDACLPDGTPAHNVSAATAAISVTVSEGVESVAAIAQEALDVAEATGQHFWSDSDGIHVTEVTQETWQTAPSGANVLINSAGQLFRSVLNNLLAILPSGIAIYDGNGNAASNILAQFTSNLVRIGGNVPDGTGVESAVQFFDQTETHDTDMTASTYFDGDGSTYQTMQSTVNLSSTLADEGKAIDTGSSGTAALDLSNALENGISATGEQHNEVHAALMADASYSDGDTTSHAAVRATATTTNGNHLSYAELIADAIGIGTDENDIYYYTMSNVRQALNCRSAGVLTMWAGTKVMNVGTNVSSFTLFTKAELQAIVGTDWTPTGANCSVYVMNGDSNVTDAMMSASINGSSIVRVHMNKTKTGNTRINYLIIRFLA